MLNKAIATTTAGGFVGCEIAVGLRDAGYSFPAMDKAFEDVAQRRLGGVERFTGPLDDTRAACVAHDLFTVIHGAAVTAESGPAAEALRQFMAVTMDLLHQFLRWSAVRRAEWFVLFGSSGVFAPDDGDKAVDETTAPTSISPYAAAKRAGEIPTAAARSENFQTVSLRLGNLHGQYAKARPTRPDASLMGHVVSEAGGGGPIHVKTPHTRRGRTYVGGLAEAIDAVFRTRTLIGKAPEAMAVERPA